MLASELETDRLSLRAPTFEDVSALAVACNFEDILRVLNKQRYTEDDAETYVRLTQEGWASSSRFAWLVHEGDSLLGQVSLDLKGHSESAVIGYWLTPTARGRGYLTEAGSAAIKWALDPAGANLARIIWAAYEWNSSSLKLAQRLGFELVGTKEAGELGWNFRGRANLAHLDRG